MDNTSLYWENYRAVVLKAINVLQLCYNCLGDLRQEPLLSRHLSLLICKLGGLEQVALDFSLSSIFIQSHHVR